MLKADVARLGEGRTVGLFRVSVHNLDDAVELTVHTLDLVHRLKISSMFGKRFCANRKKASHMAMSICLQLEQDDRNDDDHKLLQDVDHGADTS